MPALNHWQLPQGIEEIMPPHAMQLEYLCRDTIDLCVSWGYQLVIPPLVEYIESLLTGTGEDMNLQTFKLIDQMSGRMLGIRADTTPQVARIDARNLKSDKPTRLCYLGLVLHTLPENTGDNRSPLQAGAEIYGHESVESDAEIICLALAILKLAGIHKAYIDLGHVGIYQEVVSWVKLNKKQDSQLLNILKRKALSELEVLIAEWKLSAVAGDMLKTLMNIDSSKNIMRNAKQNLARAGKKVCDYLDELQGIADSVYQKWPNANLNFEFAELRGYHYHTGMVFTVYTPNSGQSIALGGRYNDIGSAFGRSRPATGFSTDIKTLMSLSNIQPEIKYAIYAPISNDPALFKKIEELRQQGEIVIQELPKQNATAAEMNCDRFLKLKNSIWTVVAI